MGDPKTLQDRLKSQELPTNPVAVPVLTEPDPNESEQAPPAAGKATKKPLKITQPFFPKVVDRVKTVTVGDAETKVIPAVTKDVPAQLDTDGSVLRPAATITVKPATVEVVRHGGKGFLNGPGGSRDRSNKTAHKHVYTVPNRAP
ncbi:MAG TPA: hypothetical protein VLK33_19830 [Terriglobales bacterium]|nr:hypothetical protein [Terriglobales bacterium]